MKRQISPTTNNVALLALNILFSSSDAFESYVPFLPITGTAIQSVPTIMVYSSRSHVNNASGMTNTVFNPKGMFSNNSNDNIFQTYNDNDEIMVMNDSTPVIRTIDAKMEQNIKDRQLYTEKLNKYEEEYQMLQRTKTTYLEGTKLGNPSGDNFSEIAFRSAVKAMMWRIIAGSVTFFTSLRFSRNLATSLQIVGSDFCSKVLTMFIGERLMNKSQAGRKTGTESASRSLAKAFIWRAFAICNTMVFSLFFAKDLRIASKIAGSDAIFKTTLMFLYERVWAHVGWGKEYMIEFDI